MEKNVVVLVGPSGSGKTTIANELAKRGFPKATTCTTRNKREGEMEGVSYFFLSQGEFLHRVSTGDIVEFSIYANNFYGTSASTLKDYISTNKKVVLVMDINGAETVKKMFPENVVTIFLDRDERDLIKAILERNVSNDEKTDRIMQLKHDFEAAEKCDFVVQNKDIIDTVAEILHIMYT